MGKDGLPPSAVSAPAASLLISLLSGGVGGLCVVLVGYPFDLLKVRMQTASGGRVTLASVFRSTWQAAGWRGLYQGATAPFLAVTPIFAANFYGYELGKRLYVRAAPARDGSLAAAAFGALFSALQTSIVVIPAERVKVCMQIVPAGTAARNTTQPGAISVALRLVREGGLRSLYRGSVPTLARDIPGLVVFFTVYEALKERLRPLARDQRSMHMAGVAAAGGTAGIASWLVSLPFDVLKSRVQAAGADGAPLSRARLPTLAALRELLAHEGPRALYRGLLPVMLRAFPANAACFLGVELSKEGLGRLLSP